MDNDLKIKPKVDDADSTLNSFYELFDLSELAELIGAWSFLVKPIFLVLFLLVGLLIKLHWSVFTTAKLACAEPPSINDSNLSNGERESLAVGQALHKYVANAQRHGIRDSYNIYVKKMLDLMARITGDKPHFDTKSHNQGFIQSLFHSRFFSSKSYEFCLKVALVYPMLLLLLSWGIGGLGTLGKINLFSKSVGLEYRWLFIGMLAISVFFIYKSFKTDSVKKEFIFLILAFGFVSTGVRAFVGDSGSVFLLAIVGAAASAAAAAFSAAIAGGIVFSVAGGLAFSDIGGFFVAGSMAVFFVGFCIFYLLSFLNIKGLWFFYFCFVLVCSSLSIILVVLTSKPSSNLNMVALPLFAGILPIVNSVFDWVSLAFTRALLFKLIEKKEESLKRILGLAFLDLGLAIIFLWFLITAIVSIIALVNGFAFDSVRKSAFDLNEIFLSLHKGEKWQDNLWIHLMMLSTLIPTLCHFLYAVYGFGVSIIWYVVPKDIEKMYSEYAPKRHFRTFVYSVFGNVFVLVATITIIVLLGLVLYVLSDDIFTGLLCWAITVADFFDPTVDLKKIFPT